MTPERINEIFELIQSCEIDLDPDPLALGPKYIQDLVARGRNCINKVLRALLDIMHHKQLCDDQYRRLKMVYELECSELLATDDRVRKAPSIKDREAIVRVLLKDRLLALMGAEAEAAQYASVEKAVREKLRALNDTMGNINTQRIMMGIEIKSGNMYGDERSEGIPALPGSGSSFKLTPPAMLDEKEIEELLGIGKPPELPPAQSSKAVEEPSPMTSEPPPSSSPTVETEKVDDVDALLQSCADDAELLEFLGVANGSDINVPTSPQEDDFSSLF